MIDSLFDILAQATEAAPAAPAGGKGAPGGIFGNPLIFPLVMIVIFYVLLIRPQQKQRKELAKKVSSLQTGDKVITAGGIHGMIHKVSEKTVTLKVDEGSYMKLEKSSIQTIVPKKTSSEKTSE